MADPRDNLPPLPPPPQNEGGGKKPESTKIEYIEDDAKRRAAEKKRSETISTKAEELSRMCGVEVAAVNFCPDRDAPRVFPSEAEARAALSRFMELPAEDRRAYSRTHIQFLEESLSKLRKKVSSKQRELREKELDALLYKTLAGGDIDGADPEMLRIVSEMILSKRAALYPDGGGAEPSGSAAAPGLPPLPEQMGGANHGAPPGGASFSEDARRRFPPGGN